MNDPLIIVIREALKKAVKKLYKLSLKDCEFDVSCTKDLKHGDVQSNVAFVVNKKLNE